MPVKGKNQRLNMLILSIAVCSLFQLGCPHGTHDQQSKTEFEVMSSEDTYGIPCDIDLTSLNTPDRMRHFAPDLQISLHKAQRQICYMYEELERTRRTDGDFLAEFFPKEYPKLRELIRKRERQQAVAKQIADTIYLILKHQHPDKQCVENVKKILHKALLEKDGNSYLHTFKIPSEKTGCYSFFGYNIIEYDFFDITFGYVGYNIWIP